MGDITPFPGAKSRPDPDKEWAVWIAAHPQLAAFMREEQAISEEYDEEQARHRAAEADIDAKSTALGKRLRRWWASDEGQRVVHPLLDRWTESDGWMRGLPVWLSFLIPESDEEGE